MTKYKLVNQDMTTHGNTKWEPGTTITTEGGGEDCGPGWLHCYDSPELAAFMNPIHANINNPRLFECQVGGTTIDWKDKFGCTELTITKEIEPPRPTTEQRVAFAIRCALKVCKDAGFTAWANNWINGNDRSEAAARAAARAADWAARAAAMAAARATAADWAARAAARAAAMAAARATARARATGWAAENINAIAISVMK